MDLATGSPTAIKHEGRAARYRGDPATANPYPEDTEEHAIWKQAWDRPDEITGDDRRGTDPNKHTS